MPVAKSPMNPKVLRAKIDRHDSLLAELQHLTDRSQSLVRDGRCKAGDTMLRKSGAIIARADKLSAQFKKIAAIPEVRAAILKREACHA